MIKPILTTALLLMVTSAVAQDFDESSQIGPNPVLPEPAHALWQSVYVPKVVGWQDGETPKVASGLTITAYAKDLVSPRSLHTLPNGDVLVVQSRGPNIEPVSRPKDYIRGLIMAMAHGSGVARASKNMGQ